MLQLIKALRLIEANHVGDYSVLVNNAARFVSNKTGLDLAFSTAFVNSYFNYCKTLRSI
jgi:serine phosphatase RsbU (regulator of sigma subunit)